MRIDEYFHDPNPPPVQGLVVVTYAIVRDEQTRVLLVRRIDDGNWELPGGRVEVGETASTTAIREVEEESGIAIELTGISGSTATPPASSSTRSRAPVSNSRSASHARPTTPHQQPRPDGVETTAAQWSDPLDTEELPMHPDVRRRLTGALKLPGTPQFD